MSEELSMNMRTGAFSGSFDPLSNGHETHARKQSARDDVDRLVIAVAQNPEKKGVFSIPERVHMIKELLCDSLLENGGNLEVIVTKGITVIDLIRRYGDNVVMLKGVRNNKDIAYEKNLHKLSLEQVTFNEFLKEIDLELIQSDEKTQGISSSIIRAIKRSGGLVYGDETSGHNYISLKHKPRIDQRLGGIGPITFTGGPGTGKTYSANQVISHLEDHFNIDGINIDLDKIWHKIIGESTLLDHIYARQQLLELIRERESQDQIKPESYVNKIFSKDNFIKEEGRKEIRSILMKDITKKEKLQAIAWPRVYTELQHRMSIQKGVVIINSAIAVETNTLWRSGNNVVLVSSDQQNQQLGTRDKIDKNETEKFKKRQLSNDDKKQKIMNVLSESNTGQLIDFKNNMAGKEDFLKLSCNVLKSVDIDGSFRFSGLMKRLDSRVSDEEITQRFQVLKSRYDEEGRSYHGWSHIMELWNELYSVAHLLSPEELNIYELAILFHDYEMKFYKDGGVTVDEEESSKTATKVLRSWGVDNSIIEKVCDCILRTRHSATKSLGLRNLVEADLIANDLNVLSRDRIPYSKYTHEVRNEYKHFSDAEFDFGRRIFLKSMLDHNKRDQIYPIQQLEVLAKKDPRITHEMIEEWKTKEGRAIHNLEQEYLLLTTKLAYQSNDMSLANEVLSGDKTINVGFGNEDPVEKILSNLAPTEVVIDGVTYGSVEAFWQTLKLDPNEREQYYDLSGLEAVRIRKKAERQLLYSYRGRNFAIGGKEHHNLMRKALRAKFEQNNDAREALISTKESHLVHLIHNKDAQSVGSDSVTIPADVFIGMLLEIRQKLIAKSDR